MGERDYLVTVCAACRTASCWHGTVMCAESRDADTLAVPASQLRAEGREHPSRYSPERLMEVGSWNGWIDQQEESPRG